MIHRPAVLNVKKLERTSACATKLSVGRTYETATTLTEKKTHGREKNMQAADDSYTSTPPRENKNPRRQKARTRRAFCLYGALDRIRTCDRSVRSRVLYPAELRVQIVVLYQITTG